MAVIRPVKLTITNYPEGQSETFEVENNPNRPEDGRKQVVIKTALCLYGGGGIYPMNGRALHFSAVSRVSPPAVRIIGSKNFSNGSSFILFAASTPDQIRTL